MPRTYLDNAATSWPKPTAVYDAVDAYQRKLGAPAGRGTYREAVEVDRLVDDARRRVGQLIGVDDPRRILFTHNGTDSLNLALHGTLRRGDHIVTTVVEHNSVLRPLRFLESQGIEATRIGCDCEGVVSPDDIRQAVRSNTRMIALVHASNVTGAIQPVAEVGRLAKEFGVLFLIDAAQSLGHLPLAAAELHADLLAAPGHKGLLGPLGTGLLYVAPQVEHSLRPVRHGGTGTHSESDEQPESLPDRYESGNLNVPGIVGVGAGASFLVERGLAAVQAHESRLTNRLLDGLQSLRGIRLFGPRDSSRRLGVVSLSVAGYDPQEVAALLDATFSIQVRSGLHCAPRMHEALGTTRFGGTIRLSLGPFTTEEDIDATVDAFASLTSVL